MSSGRITILDARTNEPLEVEDSGPIWHAKYEGIWEDIPSSYELAFDQTVNGDVVGSIHTGIVVQVNGVLNMNDGQPRLKFSSMDEAKEYALATFNLQDAHDGQP